MRFDRELLKGTTETLVLAVLARMPGHGYELVQRLRAESAGIFELGEGTLYPLLYKLEARGWIGARDEAGPSGRNRRVYHVTSAGKRQLERRGVQWSELVRGMTLVLGGAAHA